MIRLSPFTQFLFSFLYLTSISFSKELTSLHGKAIFPEKIAQEINTNGLSLAEAKVTLEGKYNHPSMPYPKNWKDMPPLERRTWRENFTNSDQYPAYQQKVKEAQEKRFRKTTTAAADGSFSFKDIEPSWYQLKVQIMPPHTAEEPDFRSARAYALRQFFIRQTETPHQLGDLTLKLKNVLVPGDQAPDFTITKSDGSTYQLSDLRGKYVLFDFWATWCGPCIAQIPNLEACSEKFSGENFVTLGLSVDQKQTEAEAFLKKNPSHYLQGYVGSKDTYKQITTAYGFSSIPSIWLIDPDGKIVAKNLMGPRILETVEKTLKASGN